MTILDTTAILISLAAFLSWVNYRFIGLPQVIGLMIVALVLSTGVLVIGQFRPEIMIPVQRVLTSVDFNQALMHGMLSFLLFAGALHINLNDLARQKWVVGTLASIGVIATTFIVGTVMWWIISQVHPGFPYLYGLLFGALIAPTDPIAVMAILKTAGVPDSLRIKIAGESLFNDGVAVVVFIVLLRLASGEADISAMSIAGLFVMEALGGAIFGLVLGFVVYQLIRRVDNYQIEIMMSLALVMGGYSLASAWHLSGPIAIVVAGLFMGNQGRYFGMSEKTREHLDTFWELVDEMLNALLFLLIGLEVMVISITGEYLGLGLIAIVVALLARFVSVAVPVSIMKRFREFTPGSVRLLTWGGLRGGISVALALSLPAGPYREVVLAITYIVVVFSIIVQGLSIKPLARWLLNR
ncbi:MAG: sodium:proton antiporter [Gammaproteobacteria bacterium]|nr:sodium:proton antiporter [Gammaproteobacteria bacterium]